MHAEHKINIAVCDDIQADRRKNASMTKVILDCAEISCSIKEYESAASLLHAIQIGAQYSILLLDVMLDEMDEMDGIELARILRKQENKTDIIFVSANREMAMCGYEVEAARYLGKPIEADKLKEALIFCCKRWREKKEILLPTSKGQRRTSYSDIQFVEAFDRGTRFVLTNETIETKLKFGEAKAMLPKSAFILCHRAYMVNVNHVINISPYEFKLNSGVLVPISKARYNEVKRKFIERITD